MRLDDWGAVVATTLVCVAYLTLLRVLRKQTRLSSQASRKLTHIGIGALYLACWSLFSDDSQSKYVCGLVPTLITTRFLAIGLGILHDEDTVRAVSTSGRRTELFAGPFEYGCVFIVLTMLAWRRTAALLVTAVLCFGDGCASLVGLAVPRGPRLPHNPRKSLLGSATFLVVGALAGLAGLRAARATHWFAPGSAPAPEDDASLAFGAALVGALAESLPVRLHDNALVSMATLGWYVLATNA